MFCEETENMVYILHEDATVIVLGASVDVHVIETHKGNCYDC